MSYTYSETFTLAHAKDLAGKVVTDLYQCALLYGQPDASSIPAYRDELTILLSRGLVESYEFGFKQDGRRVLTWHYSVTSSGTLTGGSSGAGRLYSKADFSGATYFNFLTFNNAWSALTDDERTKIEQMLPFIRTPAESPVDGNGYWTSEHAYLAGGVMVQRRNFRPL